MIIVISLVQGKDTIDNAMGKLFKNIKSITTYGAIAYAMSAITFPGSSVATDEQIIANRTINR